MAQEQRRQQSSQMTPNKYGDVFRMSGELAEKPMSGGTADVIQVDLGDQNVVWKPVDVTARSLRDEADEVTVGEALEAAALSAVDKPITQSDAAAIHAAERRLTGSKQRVPGGLADEAQAAADRNNVLDVDKTTLGDVLMDAKSKLPDDKPATRKDAEAVMWAELHANKEIHVTPGGVGESVAAAARMNLEEGRE